MVQLQNYLQSPEQTRAEYQQKIQRFHSGLLFSRQWKMYVPQVQAQNKHIPPSAEWIGVREK
jgi:hypothetical protein